MHAAALANVGTMLLGNCRRGVPNALVTPTADLISVPRYDSGQCHGRPLQRFAIKRNVTSHRSHTNLRRMPGLHSRRDFIAADGFVAIGIQF